MVLSVQFKGTWFLCILGVFLLFYSDGWLLQSSILTAVGRKRQRTVFFHLSGDNDPCFSASLFQVDWTSRGMYTVKTHQGFILSLVNSWDIIIIIIIKPSST